MNDTGSDATISDVVALAKVRNAAFTQELLMQLDSMLMQRIEAALPEIGTVELSDKIMVGRGLYTEVEHIRDGVMLHGRGFASASVSLLDIHDKVMLLETLEREP